ncbi:MAG: hypothetical protein M3R48_06285, partial [Candidatus Dormibacteraeota bacterium]|nr:hypothetical protein [Candidatus Dormibacteraeota bacterium]
MTETARRRRAPALAAGLGIAAIASAATTVGLAIANRHSLPNLDYADPIGVVIPVGFAVVGGLVAARQPRNPIGWLFLAIALVTGLQGVGDQYARFALVTHPGSLPAAVWVLWLATWTTPLIFPAGAVTMTLLLLPDGHLPSRRWRVIPVVAAVLTALLTVAAALSPGPLAGGSSVPNYQTPSNPVGVAAFSQISSTGGSVAVVGGMLWSIGVLLLMTGAFAPFRRMRRSKGDERQQLKWIAYAVLITVGMVLPLTFLAGTVLPDWAFDIPIVLGFGVALPAAVGIAMFKYRLYDIDIVISRTLVYGSLAVFITAVYVGIAVGIGALIGGGGKPNLG